MKKYRTEKYNTAIAEVECISETAKRAVISDARYTSKAQKRTVAKVSEYARYHDSWDAARDYLLSLAENRIERAEDELNTARSEREAIHELKRP